MDPEERRVVEIWSGREVGSGYLVSAQHVLTARHVLELHQGELAKNYEVRCLGQRSWIAAELAWADEELDLGLLKITEANWEGPRVEPVRWGWVLGVQAISCTAVGFPDAQVRPDEVRDTEQVAGDIEPLTSSKAKRLGISIKSSPPVERGPGLTWWSGMSGAAVFAEKAVVGVVVSTPELFGSRRLNAARVSEAVQQRGLAEVLAKAGVELHLEPLPSVRGLRFPWQLLSRRGLGSPSVLLRADRAVVPFRGRERDLEELQRWCLEDGSPLRLVVGSAGTGKTRLALELTKRMADRGWLTGFLGDEGEGNAIGQLQQFRQPVLLVVDYAETRASLRELLQPLANPTAGRQPLRLILLARAAGDWWRELQGDSDLQELTIDEEPHLLPSVDERAADRSEAFIQAADAFAAAQGMEPKELTRPDLSGSEYETILHVHMAALDAVGTPEEPEPGLAARGALTALTATLRREERYWRRSAKGRKLPDDVHVLERAVLLATLVGANSEDEAAAVLQRVPDLEGASQERRRALARWLHDLYPGPEWLGQVQPDALAEEFAAHVLADSPGLARTAFQELLPARAQRALTILDRTARRRPKMELALEEVLGSDLERMAGSAIVVAMQTGDPIGRVLARVLAPRWDATLAMADLLEEIPNQTVALREVAALLARAVLEAARRSGSRADLARAVNEHSNRLSDLGRPEDALIASQEAIDVYRDLAAAQPGTFKPKLAASLNNHSNMLSDLDRREDALTTSLEAVVSYRQLAGSHSGTFEPDLASSLNSLSIRLSALGRSEDALAACQEAVAIRRELAAARPDAFGPALAVSLNNLSNRLSDVRRYEDALAVMEEAVDLYRTLASARPDSFRPGWAMALNNLSNRLSVLGRSEDALAACHEALAIRRELAVVRSDAFGPDLVESLNNLSNRLSDVGRHEEALTVIEEAVELYRHLAAARGAAFRPDLGMALNNLSNRLSALGRSEDALTACQEAVAIRRELAAARPDVFGPDFSWSLINLSTILSNLGRSQGALAASQEAVDTYRELTAARQDTFLPHLASGLDGLSNRLSAVGCHEHALAASQEAVDAYRELAAAEPDIFRSDLGSSLNNLSIRLSDLGRHEEALSAMMQAVNVYRELAGESPDAFRTILAELLNNLSTLVANFGR